jgi:A/G-specific adenine glycosylase
MAFAEKLIRWQRRHGRRDLPWQGTRDPYRLWLSEVMLQQTQVAAVIPYYERFLARFPTVRALAAAPQDDVLKLWSGLGYYARGRNLHAAAQLIAQNGFPKDAASIERLPGVGRSTAAAIAAFAFGERAAILDGNVKRVLARAFGVRGWPGERTVQARLWSLAERELPKRDIEIYTQAIMDLGATVCTPRPRCEACPVRAPCVARAQDLAHLIPGARPRKAIPTREATWHVARHGGEVLLERRANEGLWAGLWTFPEEKPSFFRSRGSALSEFEHVFTHFRLRVRPVLYELRQKPTLGWWVPLADAVGGAVPAPVRTLLKNLPAAGGRSARGAQAPRRSRAAPASPPAAAAARRRGAR